MAKPSEITAEMPKWSRFLFDPHRYKVAYGGRGCVHGSTLIDTPSGKVAIRDFQGGEVYSMTARGIEIAFASKPVKYNPEQLYSVECEAGSIECTANHKFLTPEGWMKTSSLYVGSMLLLPCECFPSHDHLFSDSSLSGSLLDVQRCFEKLVGFLYYYSTCPHLYDGQPLQDQETYRELFQRLADESLHTQYELHKDDQDMTYSDSLRKKLDRLSTLHAHLLMAVQSYISGGSCIDETAFEQLSVLLEVPSLSHAKTSLPLLVRRLAIICLACDSLLCRDKNLQKVFGILSFAAHDMSYNLLNVDITGSVATTAIKSIKKTIVCEFYDMFVPVYNNYIAEGMIHHNSSKTWSVSDALVIQSAQRPLFILCTRSIQLRIKDSSKRVIENSIKRFQLEDQFDITEKYIRHKKTGSEFIFVGLNDLQSTEGLDIVWIEEAHTVTKKQFEELVPTIRSDGSEIWVTFNPHFDSDYIYKHFVIDEPPPDSVIVKVNYDQNPWFPDVLKNEMEWDKQNDYEKYRHVWLGETMKHSHAQVFNGRWKIDDIPEPPNGTRFYFGADWGFSQDPTTLVRCWIQGRNLYVDRAVGGVGIEIDRTPELFRRIEGSSDWPIVADSARPEMISYMQRNGFRKMRATKKGKGSIEDGVAFLRQYNIIISPELTEVHSEFHKYVYKTDKNSDEVLPIIEDHDNHYIDSLRYSCEELMRSERRTGMGVLC